MFKETGNQRSYLSAEEHTSSKTHNGELTYVLVNVYAGGPQQSL